MAQRNHEINSRPGAGHSAFPEVAQISATATAKVVPAGVMVYKISAVALTGSIDIPVHRALQVLDMWAVGTGTAGAGDTVLIANDTTAITDALDMNVSDKVRVGVATIDDAQTIIAAGSNLRVTGASAVTCDVFVLVAPVTE
jgi:hypothetical protein